MREIHTYETIHTTPYICIHMKQYIQDHTYAYDYTYFLLTRKNIYRLDTTGCGDRNIFKNVYIFSKLKYM